MRNRLLAVLVLGLLVVGCGESGPERPPVYKTTGKVTFNGAPVIDGLVTFYPLEEKKPAGVGRTNDAGEFTLTTYGPGDGAIAGSYKVTVTRNEAAPPPAESAHGVENFTPPVVHGASARTPAGGGNLLPPQYGKPETTPFDATVTPEGPNTFTFDVK